MDKEELALVLIVLFGRGLVKTAYHLLLRVEGESFGIDDFVVHKKDVGPEWSNIPSCGLLDLLGDMNKRGLLLEIEEIEPHE